MALFGEGRRVSFLSINLRDEPLDRCINRSQMREKEEREKFGIVPIEKGGI